MKNRFNISPFCLIVVSFFSLHCSNKSISKQDTDTGVFKVLGYLHSPYDWSAGLDAVDLNSITDLNLAFINPDSTGVFKNETVYREIINKAHAKNVKVYLSFGGGSAPEYLADLMEETNRDRFIEGLIAMAESNGFDGIDVDLENALINQSYPPFVSRLSQLAKSKGLLVTAALASWNAHLIPDSTLHQYDFINVMSYDKTGPWNLSKPGPHSPFSMAESDFNYFHKTRGVAANKILIGLPFYGYGFGPGVPQSMSYKNIVTTYTGAEHNDSLSVDAGGKLYYNGIPTIRQKVQFAKDNKAGGVMIWQLLGDISDDRSLLKTINGLKP